MARLLLIAILGLFLSAPSWAQSPTKKTGPAESATTKININTATIAELTKLNGVGDATAKKIIAYREANGPFKTIDDITKVSGIGPKTFEKFKDQITVGDAKTIASSPNPVPENAITPTPSAGPLININTATQQELMKLNGVGEVTAKNIIAYREANGPFKTIDDIGKVKGIGPKTLEKFKDQITVSDAAAPTATNNGGVIPVVKTPAKTPPTTPTETASGKININTASQQELMKLNGVGEVTAKNIIAYREANGPFKTLDDIGKVKGIGPKTLEKFKDQVTFGEGASATPAPTNNGGVIPVVKTPAKTPPAEETPATPTPATAAININTATAKELTKLPGVGETTAKNIIAYREANGPFQSCKDLNKVKGIGDKTLEKIEPSCAVK